MRTNTGMARRNVARRLKLGMVQQQERVNLFYLLGGQRLAHWYATHIYQMGVQQPGYISGFHIQYVRGTSINNKSAGVLA
jgi:hypothetical protein